MSITPLSITVAALVIVALHFQLRVNARRAEGQQPKEHWMVFGMLAGCIAVSGAAKENLWLSSIGLMLAAAGILSRDRAGTGDAKAKQAEAKGLNDYSG